MVDLTPLWSGQGAPLGRAMPARTRHLGQLVGRSRGLASFVNFEVAWHIGLFSAFLFLTDIAPTHRALCPALNAPERRLP